MKPPISQIPVTPEFRGGTGEPLVLLHGLTGTWRIWQPLLPALSAVHDVYAPTLPGHLGGPPIPAEATVDIPGLADGVERLLDAQGIETAHLAGNSLGGWLVLELGRRGRARSVTALSPAGGWSEDRDLKRVVRLIASGQTMLERTPLGLIAPLLRRPRSRRAMFRITLEHAERIPAAEAFGFVDGVLGCDCLHGFLGWVRSADSVAAAEQVSDHPVRIAWGERDRTIPFEAYGRPWLRVVPEAEHVTLPGVGHVPMYDDPELVVRTILEVTQRTAAAAGAPPTASVAGVPPASPDQPPPLDPDPEPRRTDTVTKQSETTLIGGGGEVAVHSWIPEHPERVVVIAHGFGEHAGRYAHVAEALAADGAAVYAPDHRGHGKSDGERAYVKDVEGIVDDFIAVVEHARAAHPGLPSALLGHSFGGVVATRTLQRGEHGFSAAVLTGPVIGGNPGFEMLLGMDPIPDVPIDPAVLSRDPEVGKAYQADPLVYHGPLPRGSLEGIFGAVGTIAEGSGFGALPVLWIHGEQDQLAPYSATLPVIEKLKGENTEAVVIEGGQHEVLNEIDKDETIGRVASFIKTHTGAPAVAS